MNTFLPVTPPPELTLMDRLWRGAFVAILWLALAVLTDTIFPGGATTQVVGLWPADAIALGFVLAWGARTLVSRGWRPGHRKQRHGCPPAA